MTAAAVWACGEGGTEPGPLTGSARLRVVHTAVGVPAVDVLVGGRLAVAGLPAGQVSAVTAVPGGVQQIAFRPAGSAAPLHATAITFTAGDTTTLLTVDSSTIINPWILSDSGAAVPVGKTKLRVVHFAEGTPALLAWRTQPGWPDFLSVQFPFPYRHASPYLQSDPGTWRVLVSSETYEGGIPALTDTLALSDPIPIPDGESRTVIVMDAVGGGVALVVLTP